jgi:hypothetical protein
LGSLFNFPFTSGGHQNPAMQAAEARSQRLTLDDLAPDAL